MFEFLFSYPREFFQVGELIPQTWGSATLIAALFVVGVVLIGFSVLRSKHGLHPAKLASLALLQVAVLVVALIMLMQPVLEIEELRPQDNKIVVLVDTSRSMALTDDGEQSRLQAILPTLTEDLLGPLQERGYSLELQSFDGRLDSADQLLSVTADNQSLITDQITTALKAASNQALAGLILVSDGADNSGKVDEVWYSYLQSYGVPIQTLGVGREVMTEDMEISSVSLPHSTIPNANLRAEVTLQSGTARQSTLKVYDGDRILASQVVDLPGEGRRIQESISVPTGEIGVRHLRFVLDPSATEYNLENNELHHSLTVAQTQPRVLYVEGEPRWEYKFIRRAAEAAGFLHLHGLVQTSTNKSYRQGIDSPDQLEDGFPTTRDELFNYQALIIGSQQAATLSQEQLSLIKDFVDLRGGSLLMLGGLNGLSDGGWQNTLVADILPLQLPDTESNTFFREQASAVITEAGLRSHWLRVSNEPGGKQGYWNLLPEIADYQLAGESRPGATVLMEVLHPGGVSPLLAYQRYGRGKTYILATGGTWRWQMQMNSEDQSHETFWQSLLQEMISEVPQSIDFETDSNWYLDNSRIELSATIRDPGFEPSGDASVEVQVRDSSGGTQNIELSPDAERPGTYRGTAIVESPGLVQLDMMAKLGETDLDPIRLYAERDDDRLEYFNTAQNSTLLKRIAAETGGSYFTPESASNILDELRFSNSGITERDWLVLWSMPFNFLLLLILKLSEWILRRRWGRL
jgi:uncharacterized membrane protein